jgi:hypothetical protein
VSYRTDHQPHCQRCRIAFGPRDGLYSPSGELLCRLCAGALDVANANRTIHFAGPATSTRSGSTAGYWALAPAVFLVVTYVLQIIEHEGSCSELACLGIALNVLAGLLVTVPCAVVAVVAVPAAHRRRAAVFGGLLFCFFLGTCGLMRG